MSRRTKDRRITSVDSCVSEGEEPLVTQLGITVNVSSSEARVAPAIYRNEEDTVDYYLINVTWRQDLYEGRDPDSSDTFQDQLRDVVVQYTVAKRFSVLKAFHEQHFAMYPEFEKVWPGAFANPFTVCGRAALVKHRIQTLDAYLNKLVTTKCAPNALSELAVFLDLPFPHGCKLTRPMNASTDDTNLVVANGAEHAREGPSSIMLAVRPPSDQTTKASDNGGLSFAVGDVVKVVKEGSSFKGRMGCVKELGKPEEEEKQVKIELIDPPSSTSTGSAISTASTASTTAAGRKTYRIRELELVSRGGDSTSDAGSDSLMEVFVGESNVHLPTGILLSKGMRRQFEYEGRINASHVDIDVEVERLWEENKRLRGENEQMAVTQAAKGADRVGRKAAEKAAAGARKEVEKQRAEKASLLTQVETLKAELLLSSSSSSSSSLPPATTIAPPAGGNNNGNSNNGGGKHVVSLALAARIAVDNGLGSFGSTSPLSHDETLKEAMGTLMDVLASESAVLHALKRLINLSLNSEEHAKELSHMGGIPHIDTVMSKFEANASIQEKSLKLLVNLSFVSPEASDEILRKGLVPRMVRALEKHPTNAGVQVKGLLGLKNLAHDLNGANAVLLHKGVGVGVRGVKAHLALPQVVTSGLGLLENVARHCGPSLVASEWASAGLAFEQVRKVHPNSQDVLEVLRQLELDFSRK